MKKILLILVAVLPLKLFGQCSLSITTPNSTVCKGTNDTLLATTSSNGVDTISYTWTYTDSVTHTYSYSDVSINSFPISPVQTTKYYLAVNYNGCVKTDSITISVIQNLTQPTLTASANCTNPDTFTLTGYNSGINYSWFKDGSVISNDSVFHATEPGIYSAMASVEGCSFSFGPIYYSPTSNPILPVGLYQEDTLLWASVNATNYTWYKNGQVIAGANENNLNTDSAGNYSYSFTSYGCTIWSDTISIQKLPNLIITSSGITSCTGTETLKVQSAGSGVLYLWSFNGQRVAITTDTFFIANYSGIYSVIDSLGNSFNTVPASYEVAGLPASLSVSYGGWKTALCNGDSAIISTPFSDSVASYTWYQNGALIAGQIQNRYTIHTGGTFSLKIDYANGCSHTIDTTITQAASLTATLNRNTGGDSLVVSATGGAAPYTYGPNWDYSGDWLGNAFYIDSAGSYSAIVQDANGCTTITDTIVIAVDTVSGVVYNSGSQPLANVPVYVVVQRADNSTAVLGHDVTDNTGKFYILTLAAEGYLFANPYAEGYNDSTYLPTYYSSAAVIQNATLVNLSLNPSNEFIYMLNASQSSGNGEVSGTIDSSSTSNGRALSTQSTGNPISGLTVVLVNSNGQPVQTTTTDANGYFQFNNLANGNYTLWIDGNGINNTNAPTVTVSSGSVSSSNLQLAVSGSSLQMVSSVTGTTSATTLNSAINIYPNPANSSFTVSTSGSQFSNFSYTLTDGNGKEIISGNGSSSVNVSSLEPGFYIVKVQTSDAVAYQKLIVER